MRLICQWVSSDFMMILPFLQTQAPTIEGGALALEYGINY